MGFSIEGYASLLKGLHPTVAYWITFVLTGVELPEADWEQLLRDAQEVFNARTKIQHFGNTVLDYGQQIPGHTTGFSADAMQFQIADFAYGPQSPVRAMLDTNYELATRGTQLGMQTMDVTLDATSELFMVAIAAVAAALAAYFTGGTSLLAGGARMAAGRQAIATTLERYAARVAEKPVRRTLVRGVEAIAAGRRSHPLLAAAGVESLQETTQGLLGRELAGALWFREHPELTLLRQLGLDGISWSSLKWDAALGGLAGGVHHSVRRTLHRRAIQPLAGQARSPLGRLAVREVGGMAASGVSEAAAEVAAGGAAALLQGGGLSGLWMSALGGGLSGTSGHVINRGASTVGDLAGGSSLTGGTQVRGALDNQVGAALGRFGGSPNVDMADIVRAARDAAAEPPAGTQALGDAGAGVPAAAGGTGPGPTPASAGPAPSPASTTPASPDSTPASPDSTPAPARPAPAAAGAPSHGASADRAVPPASTPVSGAAEPSTTAPPTPAGLATSTPETSTPAPPESAPAAPSAPGTAGPSPSPQAPSPADHAPATADRSPVDTATGPAGSPEAVRAGPAAASPVDSGPTTDGTGPEQSPVDSPVASPEPPAAGEPAPAPPAPAPHDPGQAVPAEQDGQAAPALAVPPLATPEPASRQRLRERLAAAIRRSPGIASGTIDEDPANAGERAPLRLRLRLAGAPLSPTRVRSIDVTLQFDDAPMDRPYRISELGAGDSRRSRTLVVRVSPDLGDTELEQVLGPMLVQAAATAAEEGGRTGLPTWLSPQRQAMLARLAEAYAARDEAVARARQALADDAPARLLAELGEISQSGDMADAADVARLLVRAGALERTLRDAQRAQRAVDDLERTLGLALDENRDDASSAEEQAKVSARRAAARLWMESVGLTRASYHLAPPPEDELAPPPEDEDGHQKKPGLLGRLTRRLAAPGPVILTVPTEALAGPDGPPKPSTVELSAEQVRWLAGRVAEVLGATVEASPGAAPTLSVRRTGDGRAYGFRLELNGTGPTRVRVDPTGDASVVTVAAANTDETAAAVAPAVAMALGLFDHVGGPVTSASRRDRLDWAARAQESVADGRQELADPALLAQVVLAALAWRDGEPAPGHLALLHQAGVMPGQPGAQARQGQLLAAVPEGRRELVTGYVAEAVAQETEPRTMLARPVESTFADPDTDTDPDTEKHVASEVAVGNATATSGASSAVPARSLSEGQRQSLYREILAAAVADEGRRGDWMPRIVEATPIRDRRFSRAPEERRPITNIRLNVRFRGETFSATVRLKRLGNDRHGRKKTAEFRVGPTGLTIHIDPRHGHPMAFLHHELTEYAIRRKVPELGLALPAAWAAAHPGAGGAHEGGVLAEIMHLGDRIARAEGELDEALRRSNNPDRGPHPDPGVIDELYQEIDARLAAYGYHGPDRDARWAAADALVRPDSLDPDRRRIYEQLKHRTDEMRRVLALVRGHHLARVEGRTAEADRLRGDFEQEVQALTADQRRWLGTQLGADDVELTTTLSALAASVSSAAVSSAPAIDLAAIQALLESVPGAVVDTGPTGQVLRFTPSNGAQPWEIMLGSTFGSGESRVVSSPSSPRRSIVLAEDIEKGYDLGAGLFLGQVVAGLALVRELREDGAELYQQLVTQGLMPLVSTSLARVDAGTTTISEAHVAADAAHLFRAGRLDEIPAFVARHVGRERAANADLAEPTIGSPDPTVAGLRSAIVVLAQFAADLHQAPAGTVALPPGSADAADEALGAILRSPEGRAALDGTSIGSRPDVAKAKPRPAPAFGPLPPATDRTFDEAVAAWRNASPGDRPALAERLVAAVVAEVGVVPPAPAKTGRWRRRAASTPASADAELEAVTRKAVDRLLADPDHADVHVVRAELTAALAWAANDTGPDAAPAAALTALQVMHAGTDYAVAQADRTAALAVAGEILAYHRGLDWQALLPAPAWTFAQSARDEYRRRAEEADGLADLRVSPIEAASAALPEAWSKDQAEGSHLLPTQLDGLVDRLERASAALEERALAHHRQAVAKAEAAARLTAEADTERDSREAATRQGRFRDRQSRMREAAARQAAEFAAEDAAHHRRVQQRYHAATDAARTAQGSSQRARDVAADPARAGQVDGEIGSARTDITAFLDAVRQVAPDRHVLSAGVPLGDVPGLNALTREINAVTGGRLAPADVAAMMQESWRLIVEEGGTRFTVPDTSGKPVDVLVAWQPEDAVEELVPTLRVGDFGVPVDVTESIIGQIPTYIGGRNVVGATMSRSTTPGLPLAKAKVPWFGGGAGVSAGRTRGVHVAGGQYVMSGGVMDNRGPATAFNYTGTWSVAPVAHPEQTRIVRPGEQIHDAATLTLVLPDTLTEPAEQNTSATGQNTLTTLPGHALTALAKLDDVYDEVINGLRAAGVTVDAVLERRVKTLVFELYPNRLTRTAHFTGGPAGEGLHESVDLPNGRRVLIALRTEVDLTGKDTNRAPSMLGRASRRVLLEKLAVVFNMASSGRDTTDSADLGVEVSAKGRVLGSDLGPFRPADEGLTGAYGYGRSRARSSTGGGTAIRPVVSKWQGAHTRLWRLPVKHRVEVRLVDEQAPRHQEAVEAWATALFAEEDAFQMGLPVSADLAQSGTFQPGSPVEHGRLTQEPAWAGPDGIGPGVIEVRSGFDEARKQIETLLSRAGLEPALAARRGQQLLPDHVGEADFDRLLQHGNATVLIDGDGTAHTVGVHIEGLTWSGVVRDATGRNPVILYIGSESAAEANTRRRHHGWAGKGSHGPSELREGEPKKFWDPFNLLFTKARGGGRAFGSGTSRVGNLVTLSEAGSLGAFAHELTFTITVTVGDGTSVRQETVDGSAWALLPVGMSPRDPNVFPLEYHQPDPLPTDDRLSEVLAGAKMLHLDARELVNHVGSRLGGVNALHAAGVTLEASLSRDNLIAAGMSLLTEDGFPFEVVTPALDGRKRRGSIVSRLPVLRTPRGEHRTVEIRYKPTDITYVGPTDDTVIGHIFMAMSGHTVTDERARDRSGEGNAGEGVHPDGGSPGGDGTRHRGRGETTRSFASRTGADEGLVVQVGGQYIVEVETGRYVTIDGKEEQISNGRVVLSFSELDMLQGYADGILPMQIDDALDALGRYAQGRLELDRVTAARILHRVGQDPQLSTGRHWSSRDLLPADELATKLAGEFTDAGFTGPTLTPGSPEAYLADLAAWVEQHYRDIPALPDRDQAQVTALLEHLEPQGGESRLKDLQLDTRAVPLDPRNAHLRASAARRPGSATLLDIVRDRIETAAPGAEKRNMGLHRELWGPLAGERAWQGLYDAMRSRDVWRGSFVDSHHGYDQTIDVHIAIRPKASHPITPVGRMTGVLLMGQRYGYTESGTAATTHTQRSGGLHGKAGRGDWGGGLAGTWGHSKTDTGNYAEQHTRVDRLNDRSGAYLAREDFELEISVSVRPPTRRDRMVARLHARRERRQAAVRAEQRKALAAAAQAAGGTPAQVPRSRRAIARLARDAARRSVTTVDGHVIRHVSVDALEDAYGRPRQVPRLSAEDLLPDPRGVLLSQMSYVRDTDPGPLREQLEEALKQHIGVGSPDWDPAMRGLNAALHPAHFNAMLRGMAAGGHLLVPVRVGGRTIEVRVTARFSWARDVLPDSGTPEHGYVHRVQRTAGVQTDEATVDSAKLGGRVPAVGGAVSISGPGLSLESGRTVGETVIRTRGDRDETSLFVEFPTGLAEMTVHFDVSLPIARRWRGPGMEYLTAEGTARVFVPQTSVAGELEARRTSGWSQFGFVGPLTGEAVLDYGALLLAASDDGTLASGMAPYSALIRKLGEVAGRDAAGYPMSVADPATGARRSVGERTAAPPLSVVVDQASAGRPPDPLVQLQLAASALGRDIIVDVQGPRGPELFLVQSDGSLVSRVPGDGFGAARGLLDPRYIDRAHRLGADLRAIYERYHAQQLGTPAPDRTLRDEVRDRLDELAGGPAPAAFGRAEALLDARFHGAAEPGSGDRVVAEVRRRLAGAAALSVGGHVSQLSAVVERDGVFTVSVQRSDRLVRFTVWVGEVEPGADGRLPMAQRSVRQVADEGGRPVFAADIVVSESGAVDLVLDALVHDMRETLSYTQREVAARPGLLRWAPTDHDAGVVAQLTVQARRLADLLAGVSEMQANASLEQRDVAGREVVQIVRSAWLAAAIVHEVGGADPSSARWVAMVASVSSRRDRLLLEQVRRLVTDLDEVQAIDAWWRRDAVAAAVSGIRALRALPEVATPEQAAQAEQDAIEAVLATLDPAHQAGAYDLDPPEASLAQPLLRAAASPALTPTTDVTAAMALAAAVRTADGGVDAGGLAALLDHIPVVTVPDDGGGRGLRNALLSFANDHAPSDRAVITMASEGRSAAAVFLVGEAGSPPTRVVKVFADPARMAQELSALERLAAAGLTGVRLPMPYAVLMVDTGSRRLGVLIGDHLGPTLGDLLVSAATGDSTAQAALPSAAAETGRAFRQLHEAVAGDPASGYVARHAERLRARSVQLLDDPQRYGLPATAALGRRLEEVIAAAVADPGPSSLVHGDPRPDNITLDPDQRRVGLIDLWRAHTGLDERGRPAGSAANDVAFFEEHLTTRALAEGLSAEQTAALLAAFRQAYGPVRAPDAVLTMFRARYLVRAILDAPGDPAARERAAALVGRLMDVLGIDGGAAGGTAPAPPGPGSGGPASQLLDESRRLATLLGADPGAVDPAELVHRAWLVAGLLLGSARADLDGRQRWRAMVDGLADPADRALLDGMLRLLTGGEPQPAGWRGEALATVVAAVVGLRARPELTPADVAAAQQAVNARLLPRLAPTARPAPSPPPVRRPPIWVPPWLEGLPPSQARQILDRVLPLHGGPPSDAVVARQIAALLDGRYERVGRQPVELWVRSAAVQGPGVVALTLDVCTSDACVVVSRWLVRAPDGTLELRRPSPDPHADIMAGVDAWLARALAVLSARPPRPGASP